MKMKILMTMKILRNLNKHFNDIRDLRLEYNAVKDKLEGEVGLIFIDNVKFNKKIITKRKIRIIQNKKREIVQLNKKNYKRKC